MPGIIKHDWVGVRVTPIADGTSVRHGQLVYKPTYPDQSEVYVWTGNYTVLNTIEKGENKFKPLFSCPAGIITCAVGTPNTSKNFILCNGQSLDPAVHVQLFNAIGYKYGTGANGTFKVPNLTTRILRGASNYAECGSTGGLDTVTLTWRNIPQHTHSNLVITSANEGNHAHYIDTTSYWQGNNSTDGRSFYYSSSVYSGDGTADHHWGGTSSPSYSVPQWKYVHSHSVSSEIAHVHSTFCNARYLLDGYSRPSSYNYTTGLTRVSQYDPANAVATNTVVNRSEDWTTSWGAATPASFSVTPAKYKLIYYIYSPMGPV